MFTGIFARFGFTDSCMFLEIPVFVIFTSRQIERELESICNEALNILTQNLLKVTKGKRDESEVMLGSFATQSSTANLKHAIS